MDQDERRLAALRERLIQDGMAQLAAPRTRVRFTGCEQADDLLNDLDGHPHAFVLACLMDRQVHAERAWMIPWLIQERHGSVEFQDICGVSEREWLDLLLQPPVAHRLPKLMASVLHRAVDRIAAKYDGDAARIWAGNSTSTAVVRRFLEFHGAGPKIASMAANILVRDFHVPLADHRAIDISADVHVMRVMGRLGLVEAETSAESVIYAAREINPDFPGIFDLALWDVGRSYCRPRHPLCMSCSLSRYCQERC